MITLKEAIKESLKDPQYEKVKDFFSKKYYVETMPVNEFRSEESYGVRNKELNYASVISSNKDYIERQVEIRNLLSTKIFFWLEIKIKEYLKNNSAELYPHGWEGSIKTWAIPSYEIWYGTVNFKEIKGNYAWFGTHYSSSHFYAINKDYKHWKWVAFKLTCIHTLSLFLKDFIHIVIFDGSWN